MVSARRRSRFLLACLERCDSVLHLPSRIGEFCDLCFQRIDSVLPLLTHYGESRDLGLQRINLTNKTIGLLLPRCVFTSGTQGWQQRSHLRVQPSIGDRPWPGKRRDDGRAERRNNQSRKPQSLATLSTQNCYRLVPKLFIERIEPRPSAHT
jgi:hypothetical protein